MPKSKKKGQAPNVPPWKVDELIKKAKAEATLMATSLTLTLVLTVLLDKYAAQDYIQDIWKDWVKLSEEVKEGRVKLHELRDVLNKEYDIQI